MMAYCIAIVLYCNVQIMDEIIIEIDIEVKPQECYFYCLLILLFYGKEGIKKNRNQLIIQRLPAGSSFNNASLSKTLGTKADKLPKRSHVIRLEMIIYVTT